MLPAIAAEAAYAAENFDVEVYLLVLDSCDAGTRAMHAKVLSELTTPPNVIVLHLDETEQQGLLRQVIRRSGVDSTDLMLDFMLPRDLSYGACTNRAFLIAAALGCRSVHRRDSDLRYQVFDGATIFPIHHELASIGKRAADAAPGVSETVLDPACARRPVVMVGASFVGELSVDIGEIARLDRGIYHDVVSLWAPHDLPEADKEKLVAESFTGADTRFTADHSTLTIVDPMRVDMHNIAFSQVHEQLPLPPAINTIGSDYFLIHAVHDARLPGVLHNRHIVNFHTPERKTDAGFLAYQTRFVKFLLSMLYFHAIYGQMAEAGESLLDDRDRLRTPLIAGFARESTRLPTAENLNRLDVVDRSYRKLGGRYATFADHLAARWPRLLAEARQDIEDFALLIDAWPALVSASVATGPLVAAR